MYLSSGDVHGSLLRCYQLMAGVVKAKSGASFGSGGVNGRVACQANMALASEILSFIERELPAPVSNYYRWVYGADEDSSACYFLGRYCWDESIGLLEGRRLNVRDGLASVRLMVPFEVRSRVLNAGRRHYANKVLADAIGVDESRFKRGYASVWRVMIDAVLDLGLACDRKLRDRIEELVADEVGVPCALEGNDLQLLRDEAAARRADYSGEIDSSGFARVSHVGASAVMDAAAGQEDVDAYLARGGRVVAVDDKKLKKAG